MKSDKTFIKNFKIIFVGFLILYSFIVNYYFGFLGFNFIDSFQHISGGIKNINGEIPFKDYWMSDGGPLMDVMQGILFNIYEISWRSLVVHGSIMNVLFALCVYWFCNIIKIDLFSQKILSLIAATIMYPASGTPLIDFHSFIICFAGLCFFLHFLKKNINIIIFTPLIFLISFFFKQLPAGYIAIIILIISTYYLKKNKKIFYLQFLGTLISILILLLIINIFKISFNNIFEQYFLMPIQHMVDRSNDLNYNTNIFVTSQKIKYVLLLIIPSTYSLIYYLKYSKKDEDETINYILLFSFFFIGIAHESYTLNQATTLGILPIISALIIKIHNKNSLIIRNTFYILNLIIFIRLIKLDFNYLYLALISLSLIFYFKKNLIFQQIKILILIFSIFTTIFYFEKIILSRKWQDIYETDWQKKASDGLILDEKLKGLKWKSNNPDTNKEIFIIKDTLNYLRQTDDEGRYIIITHYQIFNMILNKSNFSPVKYWWKEGSYPVKNKKIKKQFDDLFKEKINRNEIKRIVILNDIYINQKFDLDDFLWIKNCSKTNIKFSNEYRKVLNITKECV